jgi:hypothetical protein
MSLTIQEIEGVYQQETFSRNVTLSIDGVKQDITGYLVSFFVYKENGCSDEKVIDTTLATDSVILIPSSITANMLGSYIVVVIFDTAGFKTIRKARFKVEKL